MAFRSSWSPNFSRLTRTSAVTGGSLGNNTLACWFRVDDLAADYEFIQIDTPGEANYQALIHYSSGVGGLTFLQRNSNGSDIAEAGTGGSGDPVIPTTSGVWHHVAMTWDGSTLAAYVDGVQVRTRPGTPGTRGTWTDLNVGPCLGDLQDAVFYNAALSVAEIQALYSARMPKRRDSLLVHLPCFPGSNRTVDYSGLGNNFTATGSPADSTVAPPAVGWGSGRGRIILPGGAGYALTAAGSVQTTGAAALTGSAPLAAAGMTNVSGSAAMLVAKNAAGSTQVTGAAALSGSAPLAAAGSTQVSGSAVMSGNTNFAIVAEGMTVVSGAAAASVSVAPLVAAGMTNVNGSAMEGGASPLVGAGMTLVTGSAVVTSNAPPTGIPWNVHLWRRNRRGR